MRKFYLAFAFLFLSQLLMAQPSLSKLKDQLTGKNAASQAWDITLTSKTLASLRSKGVSSSNTQATMKWLAGGLALRSGVDEFRVGKKTNSPKGIIVEKFQQYYQGIKVEHGTVSLVSKNNAVQNLQLEFYTIDPTLSIVPSISEGEALDKAKSFVGATKYSWESNAGDATAKKLPKSQIVIVEDFFGKGNKLRLSYKFKIEAEKPFSRSWVYIDAQTGGLVLMDRIVKHLDGDNSNNANADNKYTIPLANTAGTSNTRYSGTQPFTTDFNGVDYNLRQTRNGHAILTLNYERRGASGANDALAIDFVDNDNVWTTAEHQANYDDAALDVQFAMEFISDYWKNIHNRDSWDGDSAEMKSYVHIRDPSALTAGYDNAFWGGDAMYYGDGSFYSTTGDGSPGNANGFKPLTSLDVSAHELGHAVCQTTAGLVYQRESGGLNEGFSDIWAACVENYSGLPKDLWKIGEEIYPAGGYLRDMANPKNRFNPDTYGGQYWTPVTITGCAIPGVSTNDYCGVHGNSSILNKWFYLITQGEVGTNDNGDNYSIAGMGFTESEQIVYLTELTITPNASFAEARDASIAAATTIFGACSDEVVSVTNAWFAVGVGFSSDCRPGVEFLKAQTIVTEGTGQAGNCSSTKIVNIPVKMGAASAQNTDINFILGGDAIFGKDYTVASTIITFNAGETGTKNLAITILDDASAEGIDSILISYTVNANGGAAFVGDNNQNFTVIITDDDIIPLPVKSTPVTYPILVNEDFEAAANGATFPAGWLTTVGSGAANRWAIGTNGGAGITGKSAYLSSNSIAVNPPYAYNNTSTTDRYLFKSFNTVGIGSLKMSFKYKADGEYYPNQELDDYGRIVISPIGGPIYTLLQAPSEPYALFGNGFIANAFGPIPLPDTMNNKSITYAGIRWVNDNNTGSGPILIDDVLITGRSLGSAVETQALQSNSVNLLAGGFDSYIGSAVDSQLIAKIRNLSEDVPCLTGELSQAGSGQIPLATGTGSYLRTEKVIHLNPANSNSTATYEGALYFTVAELAAWGANDVNLKILKVKDGVSLGGILSNDDAEIITPTSVVKNTTDGTIIYTGNFTGFSQFVLTSQNIALPVDLISFEAKAEARTIVLKWATAQEINNKVFNIERSTDGINFEEIGKVNGHGNSSTRIDYSYIDNFVQPGTIYYYRLRQVDIDGHEKLSAIQQAKFEIKGLFLALNPNPAKDQVKLFISGNKSLVDITLINAQGQQVRKWTKVNTVAAAAVLNINGLAAGVYVLEVQLPNERRVERLIIK